MGGSISSLFGVTDDESSDDYLQLTDLGGFLSKYIFIMLDKDKRKLVSKQEYLTLVNHFLEQKMTDNELETFLKRHVAEGQSTEYINESLFRKLIIHLAIDFERNIPERMKYLMTLFDKDNDGFVSELDLCQVYDAIGIQVPLDPIKSLISKYDVDGDNKLSLPEFEQLGRSAMAKLFIKREVVQSPVDELVEEALRKGSEGLLASMKQNNNNATETIYSPEDVTNHVPNMDRNNNPEYVVIEDLLFAKPVTADDLESASSLFSDITVAESKDQDELLGETQTNKVFVSDSGDFGEDIPKMAEAVLSDLQVE